MTHRQDPAAPPLNKLLAALLVAIAALLAAASVSACSAEATTGSSDLDDAMQGAAAASQPRGAGGGSDWTHVLQVVANLEATPPAEPVVVLLGGSAARECSISDASWAAEVEAAGGGSAAVYDLGSRNRTFAQDLQLVKSLPAGTIVLIGINVIRFQVPPSTPTITLPEPSATLAPYDQHRYSSANILTATQKRALVARWLRERYSLFKKYYGANARTLEQIIVVSKRRGLHPVLIDLPRNMAIIQTAMAQPISRYKATCRALAKEHGIPWVSFVAAADLRNRDFYDLWHLVEPGRVKWQALLSARTAALLRKYAVAGTG